MSAWLPHRPHAGPTQPWANSCSPMWLQVNSQNLGSQVILHVLGLMAPGDFRGIILHMGSHESRLLGCPPVLPLAPDGGCDISKHRLPAYPGLKGLW